MGLQHWISSCYRAWYVLSIKEESWGLAWCPVVETFCSQHRGYWTGDHLPCDGAKKKKKVDGEGGGRGLLAMPRARWDFRPRPHYRESTSNPSIGMVES